MPNLEPKRPNPPPGKGNGQTAQVSRPLSVGKPLGYFVSSRHERVQQLINQIEQTYGSFFEQLDMQSMRALLTYIAASSDPFQAYRLNLELPNLQTVVAALGQMTQMQQAAFLPFLFDQIQARGWES